MAEGRGGVVRRFQYPFLSPAARSGLNSAPRKTLEDGSVLESHTNPQFFEISGSRLVSLYLQRSFVHCSIKFDNDATFRTIKVGNIRTYSVLSAKFLPFKAGIFQGSPEQGLCRS